MYRDERSVKTILLACFITAAAYIAEAAAQSSLPSTSLPSTQRQSGRAALSKPVSPLDQSNADQDLARTTAIRKALVSSERFSRAAKNIQIVTTADGTVYLSGKLDEVAELQDVLNAAKQAAPGAVIVNRLQVRPPRG